MMTAFPSRFVSPILAALAIVVLLAAPARAELTVDITQGNIEPLPIAVPPAVVFEDVTKGYVPKSTSNREPCAPSNRIE